jgi:chromosome segregation ATPase
MTQTPITITYTLEEVLGQINTKLDKIDQRIEHMQDDITELKIGQVRLENEVKGEIKALDAKLTGEIQAIDLKLSGQIESLDSKLTGQIQSLDSKLTGQIQSLDSKLTGQIQSLDSKLTGEIKTLDATVGGIGKRLDTQEFINRSVIVGFVLAVGAAVVKILFPNWSP